MSEMLKSQTKFNPNKTTFVAGLENLKRVVLNKVNLGEIVTSIDEDVVQIEAELQVRNVPKGFAKCQLPFFFEGGPGAQFFFTTAEPGAYAPPHSHDEGAGVRFVVAGSIEYEGKILKQGDWMFVPAGKAYSFTVGDSGATMAYCYQCCCA